MNKKIILPVAVFAISVFAFFGTAPVAHAQTNSNPFSGLIQAIAQKFGLDQNQVRSVVNTYRQQKKTQVQQNMRLRETDRLNKLVTAGTITAVQKQQILDEIAKLKSEYNPANFKSLTSAERKAQMQKEQAEIKAWSQSTGIDSKYLMPGFGMGMGARGGMGKRGWFGQKPTPTPTP